MNQVRNIITTKALAVTVALALFGVQMFAHGGFDHVTGTIASVEGNVVTVKTPKGDVAVKMDEKTELSKGTAKASAADLKPGTRVIIDIPEGSKEKVAHSIKIGVAAAVDTQSHK
jgi:hypothetical protein